MPEAGTLHQYCPTLTAFEFGTPAPNVVVFVGGLGDGLLTVPYVPPLSKAIAKVEGWSLLQALITSSHIGWGTGSLKRDVKELGKLLLYLRSEAGGSRKKVVLVGHSTGCQDAIHYLLDTEKQGNPATRLNGAVLQAPVSDREAISPLFPEKKELASLVKEANERISNNEGDTLMPDSVRRALFNTPVSAYRFHSLVSVNGDDDYFSSDLPEDTVAGTFGKIATPFVVLIAEKDEFVPSFVNKHDLLAKWKGVSNPKYWSPLSKILEGATHNVGPRSDAGAEKVLIETIVEFIRSI